MTFDLDALAINFEALRADLPATYFSRVRTYEPNAIANLSFRELVIENGRTKVVVGMFGKADAFGPIDWDLLDIVRRHVKAT